jgi:tight adherence protein B
MFGQDLTDLAFTLMVALAVGGLAVAILFPFFSNNNTSSRVKAVAAGKKLESAGGTFRARFAEDSKDTRRRQIQESLKQVKKTDTERRKVRATLSRSLEQAGLSISPKAFWFISVLAGIGLAIGTLVLGAPIYVVGAVGFVGFLGLPRWVLGILKKRRQNVFLDDFADAIDVMVRGLKSGLPVSEAMKIIATESGDPVGPEFTEVIEGQRIGIPLDQGLERMVERVPLPEVNFLAIVMTIQSKTGGNLSEALGNLSRVLRDRKKMKAKVAAVSQEAKSSAAIIGSLPFALVGILTFMNPNYLDPLFHTQMGNMLLMGSGTWMTIGVLVMRKMINFQI